MSETVFEALPTNGRHFSQADGRVTIFKAEGVRRYDADQKLWGLNDPANPQTSYPYDAARITAAALNRLKQPRIKGLTLDAWEAVVLVMSGHLTAEHFKNAHETDTSILLRWITLADREFYVKIVACRSQLLSDIDERLGTYQ